MASRPSSQNTVIQPPEASVEIVSLAKARRILGASANSMSDNQVRELIYTLHLLAKEQLVYSGSKDYVSGTLNRTP